MIHSEIVAEITFDESPNGFYVELTDPEHTQCLSGCEPIIKAMLADKEKNDDPLEVRILVSLVNISELPICNSTTIPSKDLYVYSVVKLPYEE